MVTRLAEELGTSRKFIYGLADRVRLAVEEAMKPLPPGPKPVCQSLVVDRQQLDRAIMTLAMAGKAAERPIAECLKGIYRVEPSLGYISGVLGRASRAAEQFNRERSFVLPEAQVEGDELYSCRQPHLVAVEHSSLVILTLERPKRCDGVAWEEALDDIGSRGVDLARVGSDGGKALAAALSKLARVEQQLDPWHALRHVGRALRGLEQAVYKAMAKEEELAKKLKKGKGMDPAHPMGGYVHDRYREVQKDVQERIQRYEAMCILKEWVAEALEGIELRTGRLRSKAECLADLAAATALMRELKAATAKKLADYLDKAGPRLLAYVDRLSAPLAELAEELGEEGVRQLSRERLLERELAKAKSRERAEVQEAYVRTHLLTLLRYGKEYPGARERVGRALESVMRGSSLAECVNSWLRPYADLMKGLGDRFLPLFVLYRNAHVFQRGKRAGHSPYQLAGVETLEGDWLDWLGFGHNTLPCRAVRSLPKTA